MKILNRGLIVIFIGTWFMFAGCKGGQLRSGIPESTDTPAVAQNNAQETVEGTTSKDTPPPVECNEGQTKPCGSDIGECNKGTMSCLDGKWKKCQGEAVPLKEICDGNDNNCDGTIDEGCDCNDGDSRSCGPKKAVGICKVGNQICQEGKWSECFGAVNPSQEICDGLDNDCDGKVDEVEDLNPPFASKHIGVCQGQVMLCVNGAWKEPSYQNITGYSSEEWLQCDKLDNDCDSKVDEGCECISGTSRQCQGNNKGLCNSGTQSCANGKWGECVGVVAPSKEVCDGLDNDCDGQVDEGLPLKYATKQNGVCRGLLMECKGADGWVVDYSLLPEYVPVETTLNCDGLDNDCDGAKDEGCDCIDGKTKQCGVSDIGICRYGIQTCVHGKWSGCDGAVLPADKEICNGLDDDCNNYVDDGLIPPPADLTQGICKGAVKVCKGFVGWQNPDYSKIPFYESLESSCDGRDNDCDGKKDVGCNCMDGQIRSCGTSSGICMEGTQLCKNGVWQQECHGEVGPIAETCDGVLDENCDGAVDEGCGCTNGDTKECGFSNKGICKLGQKTCVDGHWSGCVGAVYPDPNGEVCNGKDDDCDGIKDNNIITIPTVTVFGVCAVNGNTLPKVCTGGTWHDPDLASFEFSNFQANETNCDNLDNDCDGQIDEGCACSKGDERSCPENAGFGKECNAGKQYCDIEGNWSGCVGATIPSAEVCNGKDDDCNGKDDDIPAENLPLASKQNGVCSGQRKICKNGKLIEPNYTLISTYEAYETRCDNLDNNCDGKIDNGVMKPCFTACGSGWSQCSAGEWLECSAPKTQPEVCNGKDDDCNEKIDDNLTRICQFGCDKGVETCESGKWINCTAPKPKPEICDGKDNNCNGEVDENIHVACSSKCGSGVSVCVNGSFMECNAPKPQAEICDGLDNDCDGVTDEGLTRPCSNDCGVGTETCKNGHWFGCTAPEPKTEVCDGVVDDNCNEIVDDGCECTNGEHKHCGSDVGECQSGEQICSEGSWGSCEGGSGPSAEICDGLDNDCDGKADEDFECVNGERRLCPQCPNADPVVLQVCDGCTWRECQCSNDGGGIPDIVNPGDTVVPGTVTSGNNYDSKATVIGSGINYQGTTGNMSSMNNMDADIKIDNDPTIDLGRVNLRKK